MKAKIELLSDLVPCRRWAGFWWIPRFALMILDYLIRLKG